MKKLSFLILLFLCMGFQTIAQTTVSGKVTNSETGEPIPGVSIYVESNTTIGTTTDMDGNYRLSGLPSNAKKLVFSFVGMEEKAVAINGRSTLDVSLTPSVQEMDEVIVVAYGTQKAEAKTGSVGEVSSEEMADIPVSSPESVLQGKIAGVQINSTTGQPGGQNQIRIRGFSSINAGNEPLYVIDGVPVASGNYSSFTSTGNVLANLNPSDIESMTVLKDAAAASIYGARAANGVVLIETKKGAKGEASFSFKAEYGQAKVANDNDYRFMNANEIYQYQRAAIVNSGLNPATYNESLYGAGFYASEEFPADQYNTFDWMDAAFRNADYQKYELSASGSTESGTNYYISGSYKGNEGIMPGVNLELYSFRTNLDQEVSETFKVQANISGTYKDMKDRPNESMYYNNPFWASANLLPWHTPYNDDGSFNFNLPSNNNTNWLADNVYNDQWERQYKVLGSFSGIYKPVEGLTIKSQNSLEFLNGFGRRYWNPKTDIGYWNPSIDQQETGTVQEQATRLERLTTTNTARYETSFSDDHNFSALLGQEAFLQKYKQLYGYGSGTGYKIPYLSNTTQDKSSVDYGFSEYSLMSFFSRAAYNYKRKYYISGSFRYDGNSKFGSDNRWAEFWSLSGSWNMHKEGFMKTLSFVDRLKLRASYGVNGNDNIGIYDQYGGYTSVDYNGVSATAPDPDVIGNPTLTWEENKAFNAGIDFALFDDLQGTIDYYTRKTTEMLLDVPVSRTSGFVQRRENVGSLKNTGIEISLKYDVINTKDLNWRLRANASHNQSEILDLAGQEIISDGFWRRYKVGESYSSYYVYDWAGVNPVNGMGLWYDANGNLTENYNNANRKIMGEVEPDVIGGFGTSVNYKGIRFSMQFEYKFGHSVYMMESRYTMSDGFQWPSNQSAELLNHWKEPGDVVPNPKPLVNNGSNSNAWGTSRYLENGDYLRLREITLSYTIPQKITKKASLDQVRVYVSGINLYTWHDVSYWDPERPATGGGYLQYPGAKSLTFGVNVGF